jgi:glutaconate CoA-transferase subunit B
MSAPPTVDELMAVVMSRQIRDSDFISHGAAVPLAAAALMLARRLHAPNIEFFFQGTVTPLEDDPARMMLDLDQIYQSAPAFLAQAQIIDLLLRGGGDLQFLRPAQIDRLGSVNASVIGSMESPVLRFHGIAIADAMTVVKRICFYVTEHSPRVFPAELPFVTGLGNVGGGAWRRALGVPGGGPSAVISPMAVMDFTGSGGAMRVRELMPGVSLDAVRAATGFELETPDTPVEVEPPSDHELSTLRSLDPLATRQLEFREFRDAARSRIDASRTAG